LLGTSAACVPNELATSYESLRSLEGVAPGRPAGCKVSSEVIQ
jgi:hypothetical protein